MIDPMYAIAGYLNAFLGPPLRVRHRPVRCLSRKAKWAKKQWARPVEVVEASE